MKKNSTNDTPLQKGELLIVSTGAGDLDNMTLKAYKTIKNADIVFTMKGEAGKYKELIGEKPVYTAGHTLFMEEGDTKMSEDETKKLENEVRKTIREAYDKGKKIVILENGDTTVYGPQMGYMKEFKDLNPKIIPGISSFNAANAALQNSIIGGTKDESGVTLTVGRAENKLIDKLSQAGSTMVFFMNREFDGFIEHLHTLYPKDMPIAVVSDAGFKEKEKVVIATLETIKEKIGDDLPFYKLIYVGNFLK